MSTLSFQVILTAILVSIIIVWIVQRASYLWKLPYYRSALKRSKISSRPFRSNFFPGRMVEFLLRSQHNKTLKLALLITALICISMLLFSAIARINERKIDRLADDHVKLGHQIAAIDSQIVKIIEIRINKDGDSSNINTDSIYQHTSIKVLLENHQTQIRTQLKAFATAIGAKIDGTLEQNVEVPGTVYAMFVLGLILMGAGAIFYSYRNKTNLGYNVANPFSRLVLGKPLVSSYALMIAGFITSAIMLWQMLKENSKPDCPEKTNQCNCNCTDSSSLYSNFVDIDVVGPFEDGFDTIPKTISTKEIDTLKARVLRGDYHSLHLFGGVDKRPLGKKSAKAFGNNFFLAYARASKVKQYLENIKLKDGSLLGQNTKVMIYPAGANYFGELDSTLLAQDRVVIVKGIPKPMNSTQKTP